MLNKTLKSIAAVLISLAVLAGSVPAVVAAEITEPAVTEPIVTEPAVTEPIVTEPVPGETTLPVDNSGELSSDPTVTDPSMTDSVTDPAVIDPALPGAETDLPLANDDIARPVFAVQWGMLPMYMGSNGVFQWSVALDNGGYYIYTVTNMYESAQFTISYDEDGDELLRYEANTQPVILDSLWNPIPGAYVQSYVENNTRYSEIYIPQSFFKDVLFTITCGQSVNSLDITDSFGMPAMPAIWGDVATLEEPVAGDSSDSAFIAQTESVISNPNNGAGSWGMTYENGNYCLYIKGNIWSCQAQFNLCDGNGGYLNHLGVSATPNYVSFNYNGTDIPVSNMVKGGDNSLYVKFVIPNGVFPDDFQLDPQNGNPKITSQQIKANGSVTPIEPEDPTIAAIKEKLGESNWAVELGSDGAYHLYIVDTSNDNPTVTVTNKATEETSSPILSQVISSEKDGLRYSEYTLSELPEWFDISYNGAIKTFGTNPEQAFIDNVTANSGGNWNAVLNGDGTCSIYVVSDTQPTAGEFTFENHIGGDGIYIDEAQTVSVLDPASGRYYTQLAVSNASDWFNVTYNGVTQTVGDNPDQAVIDEISAKLGGDNWKVEKGADGLYHVYIKDSVEDNVNITAADKTDGSIINVDFSASKQVIDENGSRYSEYTASIDSEWFDISYNGSAPVTFGKDPNAAYAGIVIDGEFADWDAVPRYPFYDNPEHNGQVPYTSMVWDGDRVYIYLESKLDDDPNQPANNFWVFANSGYNGVYEIRTDLNKRLIFQVCPIDSPNHCYIAGVEGAEIKVTDNPHGPNYCEISIPTSELPEYLNTISFGAYLYDTSIPNVGNMNDPQAGMDKSFNGIVYDGHYTDWAYYPHSIIYYDGQGIHVNESNAIDGEQALWSNGETIFGHVVTEHIDHLAEGGGEFTEAVTLRVNDNLDFYPRAVRVDSDGTIHWNDSQVKNLPDGEYEFYLFDTNAWSNCTNIHEFEDPNVDPNRRGTQQIYGKIHITVGASKDECEYYVYAEALAKKFNIDPEDIKTVSSQFGRIGQQWATTAGTSTGAFLGIFLCLATVSGTYFFKKKKAMGIK